jgi:hypothetical protein
MMEATENKVKSEVENALTQVQEVGTPSKQMEFVGEFRETYKLATVLCKSTLIPQTYQGKPADCAIAIDMASRMGISPIMVMQNLYVVKGKPSWSGQACMAFLRNRYADAMPVYVGEPNTDSWGCFIRVTTKDGEKIDGSTVTIQLAKREGWYGKAGSKWQTMPQQMLAYRAAAFFARVYCPELLMGVAVQGEVEDTEPEERQEVPDPFANPEVVNAEFVG